MPVGFRGASCGILLSLDRRVVEKIEECVVVCKFRCISDQFEWAFDSVCGPNLDVDN